jgi:enoyl-CoA hydratase/carnithine racemase
MLDLESSMSFEKALRAEENAQAALMMKPDHLEAYQAFMEKRDPRFNR